MPTTEVPEFSSRAQGLLEEHRQLHGHLERVEALLAASRHPQVADLASSLDGLAPLLGAHFAREEEEGLFEEVEEAWPHAAHACERLMAEHRALLTRLERLRTESRAGDLTAEALAALAAGVRSLLRDLGRHEELENQLICGSLDDAMAAQD